MDKIKPNRTISTPFAAMLGLFSYAKEEKRKIKPVDIVLTASVSLIFIGESLWSR